MDINSISSLKKLKNKQTQETIWSFATKGVAFVLLSLINIYLARKLGVELFGKWSYLFSVLTIMFLFSYFGINISARVYAAQYNKTVELKNVLGDSFKLRLFFSLVTSLLLILLYKPITSLLQISEFDSLFLLSIPLVFLMGVVEYFKSIFMGLQKIKYHFMINSIEYGLKLILLVVFLNVSIKIQYIVLPFILATLIASVFGLYIFYTKFYSCIMGCLKKSRTREIVMYSIPLFFTSICFLVATEVDTVMLGLLSTDTEVGIYAVAKQITIKLPHISLAIAMGTMPIFAKLNKDNKEELTKLFYKLLKNNAMIFMVIILFILLLSKYFIPLIFGNEYNASVFPLQILTVYVLVFSFSIYIDSFLDYQKLAKKRAVNFSVTMLLNLTLNLILIPEYGAIGAATATSISYLPYIFLNLLEVRKVLK